MVSIFNNARALDSLVVGLSILSNEAKQRKTKPKSQEYIDGLIQIDGSLLFASVKLCTSKNIEATCMELVLENLPQYVGDE